VNLKKILIITKYFTPMDEIAAIRIHSIIKYMIKLGWDISVITDIDPNYDYQHDEILSKIKIYGIFKMNKLSEAEGLKFKKTNYFREYISCWLVKMPYFKKHLQSLIGVFKIFVWIIKAINVAEHAVIGNHINYIIASVPSIEAIYLLGMLKKRHQELVSVCEYRDLISENRIYKSMFSFLYMYVLRKIELKSIGYIDKFVFLTPIIKQKYIDSFKNKNLHILNGIVITNGYDKEIYPKPSNTRDKSKLVITHVGQLYGSRTFIPLIKAIIEINKKRPNLELKIEVKFIGHISKDIESEAKKIIQKNNTVNINIIGPVSHGKALQYIVDSDINVIITHLAGSEYAIPGKLFEYIGAGNPILAVTNDGLLKDIIIKEQLGWIVNNNIDELKERLLEIIEKWEKGKLPSILQKNKIYDREYLTPQLSNFILGDCEEI
jgi:glycosyltransferase involved in cell wall biosynthesis